jgi:uncharacterized protein
MPNPVVHFEIIGKDPKALGSFYRDAFEWNIPAQPVAGGTGVAEYFMVLPDGEQTPKFGINGGFGSLPAGYGGHVTFYIAVDDVGAALEKVEKLGGTRMLGPDQVPNGPVIGLFKDPQGNTIGLVKSQT